MSRGGKLPQQRGESFENAVQLICDYLRNMGVAWIDKKATHFGFDKRSNKIYYKRKSTVDFTGFIMTDGRHIGFECKNISNKTRWLFNKDHQIMYLYELWKSGGISFLLINSFGNKIYKIVPDETWKGAKRVDIVFDDHIFIPDNKLTDFIFYCGGKNGKGKN